VHISLTNINNKKDQKIEIALNGFKVENIKGRILTSAKVQDHNTFDIPLKVVPKSFNKAWLSGDNIVVNMPANSVIVLELD